MCKFLRLIACCIVFASTPWARSDESQRLGHRSELFDGKTLNGWTLEGKCQASVQDGNLLLEAGDGWMRSDHEYLDFQLHVEWKSLKETNYDAGIYIRTKGGGSPFPKQGYQVNLLQGKEGNIGNLPNATSSGLIRPGEWNAFDISVIGDRVQTSINGKHAYEASGITNRSGHIGFQIEVPKGGQFLVRNVFVTEIGYESMFNARDLSGWEGAGQDASLCWSVEDGAIVCNGKKGPWLRSAKEYENFNMRLEYQVSAGGNSGIYVRVPKDGNHHRQNDQQPGAGFEVQVLDDTAPQHSNLKDYQYGGSVYDICGATKKVGRPVGSWNSLELNCRDQNITTIHNGVTIVEVKPDSHPLILLRQQKGFLGLQNHNTVVKFRNIRIGRPLPE